MMRLNSLLCVLGLISLNGALLEAAPVTISISGHVTSIRGTDTSPYEIQVGDTFTGIYTYDAAAASSGTGTYLYNSPFGMKVSLGGFEFKTAESHVGKFSIWLANDYSLQPYDKYLIESNQNAPLPNGLAVNSIGWSLNDSSHTALSSTALPSAAPNLGAWPGNTLSIGWGGTPNGNSPFAIWGTVTQAELVPEPATLLMLGLGGLAMRRRR